MNIYIISPVTLLDPDTKRYLLRFTENLEQQGHKVHLPFRDTPQEQDLFLICEANVDAIRKADLIYVYYLEHSKGIHFDLGAAHALGKKIAPIYADITNKSFRRYIDLYAENVV